MSVWLLDCLSPEQLRRDVGHRLASPFIWQEQGEIDKKPKRQRQQQGEKHVQHDRPMKSVVFICCDALLRNTTAKSLSH